MKYSNPCFENTNEDPEYEAGKVLAEISWDGILPIDVLTICEMYGLECLFDADPSMQEEGTTKFRGDGDFYIFINTHNTDCIHGFSNNQTKRRRQRFTLAHELAHCIYKSHVNLQLQQNLSDKNNPHSKTYTKIREDQANQFAAYLLVPKKAFQKFSRQVGWNNIAQLIQQTSDEFDVSLEVAAQQIARLANYSCITRCSSFLSLLCEAIVSVEAIEQVRCDVAERTLTVYSRFH
jgi:Zn-dependent peptidase ImmA (M78 family)